MLAWETFTDTLQLTVMHGVGVGTDSTHPLVGTLVLFIYLFIYLFIFLFIYLFIFIVVVYMCIVLFLLSFIEKRGLVWWYDAFSQ